MDALQLRARTIIKALLAVRIYLARERVDIVVADRLGVPAVEEFIDRRLRGVDQFNPLEAQTAGRRAFRISGGSSASASVP